jgi:hypothetical protein
MTAKKWILVFCLIPGFLYGIFIIFYYFIDPDQIFDSSITKKKFFYTSEFETTKLFNTLKKDKYSLVFGTSRSQQLYTDGTTIDILNFAALYGNSINVLEFLKQLNNNQIKNINKIYYLVDDHCLNGYALGDPYSIYKKQIYNEDKTLAKLKYLIFINPDKIMHTFLDLKYNYISSSYYMNEFGSMVRKDTKEMALVPNTYKTSPTKQIYTKEGLDALIKIDKFCKNNGIKISYFTPTHFNLNNKLQDEIIMKQKWLYLLNNGLDGFYALWSIDGISNYIINDKYICFKDTSSHLNSFYNHKVFINNVVNKSKIFYISNEKELNNYFEENKFVFMQKPLIKTH